MVILEDIVPRAVDYPGLTDPGDALPRIVKAAMDVAVEEVFGPVAVDQASEDLKPPVAGILSIVNVARWSVSNDHIDTSPPA
jgi:hypothetical protein